MQIQMDGYGVYQELGDLKQPTADSIDLFQSGMWMVLRARSCMVCSGLLSNSWGLTALFIESIFCRTSETSTFKSGVPREVVSKF